MNRRLAICYVDEQHARLLFDGRARIENLPAGYELIRVIYDAVRCAFGLLVTHDSFDLVPLGQLPPSFVAELALLD
jgi:hypothetical protein